MKWKDNTFYSRDDKERISSVWNYSIGGIVICIHKHIHYAKDQWLLTCTPFYNKFELPQDNIDDLKELAIKLIITKIRVLYNAVCNIK